MKYKVIFTHDPQDFFNGDLSAEETSNTFEFDIPNDDIFRIIFEHKMAAILFGILQNIQNGYKAIILPKEGDNSG